MSNRITLQPAFVLHAKPFRDTSLLVDMLTLQHGRINVLARSARGLRSRFRGLLQPFIPFLASWSGKSELQNLNVAESNGLPYYLTGTALISGFYLNELLVRLLHRYDVHPNIYMAYQSALVSLQRGDNAEQVLRLFELQLLADLGYGLSLDKEAETEEPIIAEKYYRFDHGHGFIPCFNKENSRIVFAGKTLLALHRNELQDAEDFKAAKSLLRLVLAPLLGDKPIKSRELFVKVIEEED